MASSFLVKLVETSQTTWFLTEEGKLYEQQGAPEAQAWAALATPLTMAQFVRTPLTMSPHAN
jgi:hypothetical protein